MRLIHTADIHLDHCFAPEGFSPRLGSRRRQSLRQVFEKIVKRAADWPADAVLLAGDVFDLEHVSRQTVTFLHDAFARLAPVPVVIAPGNHDPFVPDSPYALESWPEHVYIFHEPRWSSIALAGDLVVHGFGFDGFEISRNPFGELKIPNDGRVHVGVAHASEVNHLPLGQKLYCPFKIDDGMPEGMRYLALGHYHAHSRMAAGRGVAAYSGAPEGLSFRDRTAGHYLELEVTADDVVVTPVRAGAAIFREITVDCTGITSAQALIDEILGGQEGGEGHVMVRANLVGLCDPAVWAEWEIVRESLQSQFEHVEIADHTEPLEDFDSLSRENTSLGGFAATILEEIRTTPPGARHQLVVRARDVGLAAFRDWDLPVRGLGRE